MRTALLIASVALVGVCAALGYVLLVGPAALPKVAGSPPVDEGRRQPVTQTRQQGIEQVVAEAPAAPPAELVAPAPATEQRRAETKMAKEAAPAVSVASRPAPQPETATAPPEPAAEPAPPQQEAPQPRTIDQIYDGRSAAECQRGFGGMFCREKIRFSLCDRKWTETEMPGMRVCYAPKSGNIRPE